jgi:hypothetical protein
MNLRVEYILLQGAGQVQLNRKCWRYRLFLSLQAADTVQGIPASFYLTGTSFQEFGGASRCANDCMLDLTAQLGGQSAILVAVETWES